MDASPTILMALVLHPTTALLLHPTTVHSAYHRALYRAPLLKLTALSPEANVTTGQRDTVAATEADERTVETAEAIAIAGPALVSTLIDPLLSLIDTAWVGRLGQPYALGATAAASELFTLAFAASLALREASSSSIARFAAAGRTADAAAFARRTLMLAVVVGSVLAIVVGGPTAPAAVSMMGAHAGSPLYADALAYARARALFLPAALACSACEGAFRGFGDTRTPLRAAALAAIVNAVLDPLCIFAPLNMGVRGAAYATGVAQLVSLAVLLGGLRPRLASAVEAERGATADSAEGGAGNAATMASGGSVRSILGTTSATLLRSCSTIGCWVFIASAVSRLLGPTAIAAHGVVLKLWLMFVLVSAPLALRPFHRAPRAAAPHAPSLMPPPTSTRARAGAHALTTWMRAFGWQAAEAPAVAAQVLCARRLARGQIVAARQLLLRLLRIGVLLGTFAALALGVLAAPASHFFFPTDAAAALTAISLFRYASLAACVCVPTVILEAVLNGAGRSYRYLALATLANAIAVATVTRRALSATGASPVAAWRCIVLFFVLRLTAAAGRVFGSPRGGFVPPHNLRKTGME